jgi:hypothetical protein
MQTTLDSARVKINVIFARHGESDEWRHAAIGGVLVDTETERLFCYTPLDFKRLVEKSNLHGVAVPHNKISLDEAHTYAGVPIMGRAMDAVAIFHQITEKVQL